MGWSLRVFLISMALWKTLQFLWPSELSRDVISSCSSGKISWRAVLILLFWTWRKVRVLAIAMRISSEGTMIFFLFREIETIPAFAFLAFILRFEFQTIISAIGNTEARMISKTFRAVSFNPKFSIRYSVISRTIHPLLINISKVWRMGLVKVCFNLLEVLVIL